MKRLRLIPFLLCFVACNNRGNEVQPTEIDSSKIVDSSYTAINPGSAYEVVNTSGYYVWEVDAEKKTLKKNPDISATDVNIDSVINGLNRQYENIQLEKTGLRKDSLYLKIPESDYLTNQSGSSGAAQYLAQAVINLTSVPGVKYVHIDFKMGSHASPGTWTRKDFPGYIIIQ